MKLKPIETRYKGYRFRSRLEARWAVFFDSMNIKWEYEKQGYILPRYKFDKAGFMNSHFIDSQRYGLEEELKQTADRLESMANQELTYLPDFWLPDFHTWAEVKPRDLDGSEALIEIEKIMRFVNFSEMPCLWCDEFSDEIMGMEPSGTPHIVRFTSLKFGGDEQILSKAITAARSSRFEHGDSPHSS